MLKKILAAGLGLIVAAAVVIAGVISYNEIRYPLKYQEEVEVFSSKYSLNKNLVNSIINAESRFDPDAVSHCGARGLMQIMPSTGLWVAGEIGIENFVSDDLFKPEVNIEIGSYYFKYLFDKFNDKDLAIAAYNAGEGNVARWLNSDEYSKDGALTNIPYKETRDYLARVNKFARKYEHRLSLPRIKNIV